MLRLRKLCSCFSDNRICAPLQEQTPQRVFINPSEDQEVHGATTPCAGAQALRILLSLHPFLLQAQRDAAAVLSPGGFGVAARFSAWRFRAS